MDLDNPTYAASILNDDKYCPARNINIHMPRFDGNDVEDWLFQVRRFFIYNKTPEEQKLLMASFHIDGIARKWFSWMEASNFLTDWKRFVKDLCKKFGKGNYTLPGGKLSKLMQLGSVAEYQTEFEERCTRCLGLPDYFIL